MFCLSSAPEDAKELNIKAATVLKSLSISLERMTGPRVSLVIMSNSGKRAP